ncbi:hypothetical protein GOP47_0026470 [Adiantum capillus-veneris]|nr:hypothetical protein GOP47_0026470 [Adiantum capillus-veneris]
MCVPIPSKQQGIKQGVPSSIPASSMLDITTKGTGVSCFPQASASASIAMPLRDRFYVELKPGETTFVSWKKLVKESQKTAGSFSPSSEAPIGAHPALEARIAPEAVKEKDPLPPPSNRYSSVIEKIERLYQGGSSDDEFEVMDDDKYDTRDSFIDDTELDDYFSVEKAKLKHSGFFINKGTLEKEVDPASTLVGPKKRKRKDLQKLNSSFTADEAKQSKPGVRLKDAARGGPSPSSLGSSCKVDIYIEKQKKSFCGPGWEMGKSIAMAVVEKELNNARTNNMLVSRDIAGNKTEGKRFLEDVVADTMMIDSTGDAKDRSVGLIDINEPLEKDAIAIFDPRDPLSANGLKSKSVQRCAREDAMKESLSSAKRLPIAGKEVSPGRNKGTALEKAFLDLEKDVTELYPPSSVVKEPEQGKRNRLPRDLKQKLAKVARLAAKQGRITDDMIERLMGILGHVIRERTLKRHLKAMIEMGVSAMQEKEGRLKGIKKEVTEMIKSRVLNLQTQDSHRSNNMQSMGASPDKASGEGPYQWDHATEDKICDLYEQYIEGMDVNKGPHLRKLYAELAELWPDGWMDNIGIKLAVHRAKERKRKLSKANNSSEAKIRRRPMKAKTEDSSGDGLTLLQLFAPGEKSSDPTSTEKIISHGHDVQLLLQEKKKVFSKHGGSAEGKSKSMDESLFKKKSKKEAEKGIINVGASISLPPNMGSSMGHASFSSPLPASLPLESPLPNSVGTANGAYISPH